MAILMLTLLSILGTLQYRWLGQLSAGERERMHGALHAGALRFGEDFDRELARAYAIFQMDSASSDPEETYAERYSRWDSSAPFPQLVSGVFLISVSDPGGLHAQEFNKATKRFEPVAWPSRLEGMRHRLEEIRSNSSAGLPPGPLAMPPILDEDPPVLVIPVLEALHREGDGDGSAQPDLMFQKWIDPTSKQIVVVLNASFLKNEFISALGRRYFSNSNKQLEYTMRVTRRSNPGETIYASESSLPEAVASSANDESIPLFSLRPDLMENFTLNGIIPARLPVGIARIGASHEENQGALDGVMYANGEALWQLRLKHRNGSVEEVVAGARKRNLLISATIMLVLTGSVLLILITSQRARKLAHQQVEFVAGVSHELLTPIAVITSAAANLSDGVVHNADQVKQYGSIIKESGLRLGEMVEKVLEFAGTKSGKEAYQFHPLEVASLIEDALASCQSQITERRFIVEKAIAPKLPLVPADRKAISRALQNLLNNAIKYSGEERVIRLSALLATTKRGVEVVIAVEDKGIGIAAGDLTRIFEPFQRGREALASQIHGNGLGLALARRIVEAHRGRIRVKSTEGVGSVFSLHLPALPQSEHINCDVEANGNYEQAYPAC